MTYSTSKDTDLRALRLDAGMTQASVARIIGLTQSRVTQLETSLNPQLGTRGRYVAAVGRLDIAADWRGWMEPTTWASVVHVAQHFEKYARHLVSIQAHPWDVERFDKFCAEIRPDQPELPVCPMDGISGDNPKCGHCGLWRP